MAHLSSLSTGTLCTVLEAPTERRRREEEEEEEEEGAGSMEDIVLEM